MPFDISGDKIIFDGYPIAQFTGAPWLGLRIECENLLKSLPDMGEMVSEEDHEKAINEAVAEAEETTKGELNEEHEKAIEIAEENAREEGRQDGFIEGRADALEAAGKAADVFRVDALLKALAGAEMALRGPLNGIVNGDGVRRPAKIGDLKTEMRSAIAILRNARAEYVGG